VSDEVTDRGRLAGVVAAGALALAAPAFAATPLGGATYRDCARHGGTTVCKVNQLSVAPSGRKITQFVAFTRCAPVPFKAPLAMRIARSGAFGLTAKRTDVSGRVIRVSISGKFVSPERARGTMRFTRAHCNPRAVTFSARVALG
jgi:hypothetical protein